MLLIKSILAAAFAYWARDSASLFYPELLTGGATTLAFLRWNNSETV